MYRTRSVFFFPHVPIAFLRLSQESQGARSIVEALMFPGRTVMDLVRRINYFLCRYSIFLESCYCPVFRNSGSRPD